MNKLNLKIYCLIWQFERAQFYRDMADAFNRKVSLRDFIEREISNARLLKNTVPLTVLKSISRHFATGDGGSLRELMHGIAPQSDQMLLSAVDETVSNKSFALEKSADAVDLQIRNIKALLLNLAMPAVLVPIVGVLCVITSEIVASIAQSAPPEIWTGFNGIVRVLANLINSFWLQIFVGLFLIFSVIVYLLPRWVGKLRLKFDNLPLFSLYRDYNAAIVVSGLAMMMSSGKTLRHSLEDLRPSSSRWLRWHLQRIINSLEDNPTDYVAAFSKGLIPMTVRARLASLLDSEKSFDQALIKVGTKEVGRLESNVKLSAQAVNYSLTGALVVVAVILSIGQMTIASALSREADPSRIMRQQVSK